MPFYLAIDAGGTKTDYVLADESRELARVRSGTIKRMRAGEETATTNLDAALTQLTAQCGIAMHLISRTCIGTAGETVPLVTNFLRAALGARVSGSLLLLGDVEIALDAAFPNKPGVLVLAGTGSNVAGRATDGKLTSAGGWGPALADQGSGHRIGLAALRAAFLALDQGRATSIFESVFDLWNLPAGTTAALGPLIEFANSIPAPDFSQLVPAVLRCAEEGDEVAADVLREEGDALGYLARLVLRRLSVAAPQSIDPPAVAFSGSIMEHVRPVRDALVATIRKEFPLIRPLDGVVDPVLGALSRARNTP
jgi:glucosamine kinase